LVDRKTYLAVKGKVAPILSSDVTKNESWHNILEGKNTLMDASQSPRSKFFKLMKHILPPSVKNAIKPILRLVGFLPPDPTPDFLKKKND
jgi:hypothetical protein